MKKQNQDQGGGDKPHTGVYIRLGVSKHGIGVFAITDIPKGTNLTERDVKAATVLVKQEFVEALPEGIRKMYHDFCPLNDGVYECPESFAQLTPSWYLNDAGKNANAEIDENLDFIAARDIKEGEEVTANYSTYSEIPPGEEV